MGGLEQGGRAAGRDEEPLTADHADQVVVVEETGVVGVHGPIVSNHLLESPERAGTVKPDDIRVADWG
ncbi:hypothetical protein Airi01_030540 [Actinoallomurus iriomotensis]|uniref:Uncharacterized protein n=1 Tax=Actinoallomurus iriomotensis TaxID=478107 RepID=A0A9W6RIQ6_9ACTN|nr:hypothetical protein Airi01_030540 [Actinoallomurus iriomotensis]